tara:strand:- start:120 stop:344 length:225 start_codon:yes stop_codon:yes gene_type:complete
MKKIFFTFLLLTQYLIGFSQFSDDFSDRNFTSNPNWIGDLGGLLLKTGMYIIWVELFLEKSNVERFKKVVVLSR